MRKMLVILFAATIGAVGCTDDVEPPSADDVTEIYSTVIRRLVTEDNTFGGKSPFKHVYVINGPVRGAGDLEDDYSGSPSEPFPSEVIAGIEESLEDLPPVTFVVDGDDLRYGRQGMGGVKKNGVIISLGPITREKERIHVSNSLWCGGDCGQWLTYELIDEDNHWTITGTTGSTSIS